MVVIGQQACGLTSGGRSVRRRISVRASGHFGPTSGANTGGIRRVLIALVIIAFCIASAMSVSAPHSWLDGDSSAPATATADLAAKKGPVQPGSPIKSAALGGCTGHCMTHTTPLLSVPLETVAAVPTLTHWVRFEADLSERWSSFALERPPRV